MIDYKDNDLIDECLVRFYETFKHTLDTADYVPKKYNDKILKYIFKRLNRKFKQIDRACKMYERAKKRKAQCKKR